MVKNAIYKLCSDKIMSELFESRKSGRPWQPLNFIHTLQSVYRHNLPAKDIDVDGILSKMKRQQLIIKDVDLITLTVKGKKRFKRTTQSDRDKWKREISSIVCSWLIR